MIQINFKIATGFDLSTTTRLTIQTDGNVGNWHDEPD